MHKLLYYLALSGMVQYAAITKTIGTEVAKLNMRQSLIPQAIHGKIVVPVV